MRDLRISERFPVHEYVKCRVYALEYQPRPRAFGAESAPVMKDGNVRRDIGRIVGKRIVVIGVLRHIIPAELYAGGHPDRVGKRFFQLAVLRPRMGAELPFPVQKLHARGSRPLILRRICAVERNKVTVLREHAEIFGPLPFSLIRKHVFSLIAAEPLFFLRRSRTRSSVP